MRHEHKMNETFNERYRITNVVSDILNAKLFLMNLMLNWHSVKRRE